MSEADLKEHEGTIETAILGTSLIHRGLDAVTLGKELNSTCFSFASPAQPVSGSYYILKDALKRNPIKQVFFGVGVTSFMTDSGERSTTSKVKTLKLIRSLTGKANFILSVAEPKELETLAFCPARVKNTLDFETIRKNIRYKTSDLFQRRKSYPSANLKYYGMGTEGQRKTFSGKYNKPAAEDNIWDRERIVENNISYMKKMAEMCRKEGVEFNLVVLPLAECFSEKQGDLTDMDAYLEEFAEEIGAGVYNYNHTSRTDIYEQIPVSYYADVKHMNHKGASAMARLLAADCLAQ